MYFSYVLPLTVIMTQALLLLLAIAIEAVVIQRQLMFAPSKSVEYSASLNLLSTVLGWLVFFVLADTVPLPEAIELELLNLIFFDQPIEGALVWLLALGFTVFFGTILIERIGFTLLQWLLEERNPLEEKTSRRPRFFSRSIGRTKPMTFDTAQDQDPDPLYALVWANAASYMVIVAMLITVRVALTLQV